MKKLLGIVLSAAMLLSMAACGSTAASSAASSAAADSTADAATATDATASDLKVGVITIGDETEGYTAAHINGIKAAAQKLGSRFVKTVISMNVDYISDVFARYVEKVKQPTYAIAYGVFCAAVGIDMRRAMESFLYTNTSGKVVSCVKTIPLSQTQGQQILKECHKTFTEVLDRLESLTERELCRSTPGFDVRCMQHETLYSRLYMS